jgi:hypothetical protein
MPIDPSLTPDIPQDVARRALERVVALEQRVQALERGTVVPIFTGTPSGGQGRDGSIAASTTNVLWVKIGGTWRSVAVT